MVRARSKFWKIGVTRGVLLFHFSKKSMPLRTVRNQGHLTFARQESSGQVGAGVGCTGALLPLTRSI